MCEKDTNQFMTLDGCPITPGPWVVRSATFCDDGIPSFEVVMPGRPHMSAVDARVIGIAPVLFAACQEVRKRHDEKARRCNFDRCGCDDCVSLEAALALANVPTMPRLDFICDQCGVQQHADGICANCGANALRAQTTEVKANATT